MSLATLAKKKKTNSFFLLLKKQIPFLKKTGVLQQKQ